MKNPLGLINLFHFHFPFLCIIIGPAEEYHLNTVCGEKEGEKKSPENEWNGQYKIHSLNSNN